MMKVRVTHHLAENGQESLLVEVNNGIRWVPLP